VPWPAGFPARHAKPITGIAAEAWTEWPNGGRNNFVVCARMLNGTAKRLLCRPARS
jgi:hypothetical protein